MFCFRPEKQPSWLKHDRETLRFYAYFQQPVHESPTENYRARSCLVLFYLEDGTMQILEPKIENSGIPQGAFLRRHRFPKADGSGFFTMDDLRVSESSEVFPCCELWKNVFHGALLPYFLFCFCPGVFRTSSPDRCKWFFRVEPLMDVSIGRPTFHRVSGVARMQSRR